MRMEITLQEILNAMNRKYCYLSFLNAINFSKAFLICVIIFYPTNFLVDR